MEVRVFYAKAKLEATVDYITARHPFFKNSPNEVRESIMRAIQELVDQYPKLTYVSRDGFYVWMDSFIEEGVDQDENAMNVEFMVDPYVHEFISPPYTSVVLRK